MKRMIRFFFLKNTYGRMKRKTGKTLGISNGRDRRQTVSHHDVSQISKCYGGVVEVHELYVEGLCPTLCCRWTIDGGHHGYNKLETGSIVHGDGYDRNCSEKGVVRPVVRKHRLSTTVSGQARDGTKILG